MTKSSTNGRNKSPRAAASDSSISQESSGSPLTRYRDKRDPGKTNEPFSAERIASSTAAKTGTRAGEFVVHLHDATRRHYDLRLQIGSRLLSFAIPRGPSLLPLEKRLAVHTEDHPIEYLDFEDVIPEGGYGAGPMIVWDIGRVLYLESTAEAGMESGKLDFLLFGRKLNGRFALVETGKREKPPPKQRQWLLIKKVDAYSREQGDIALDEPRSVLSGLTVEELLQKSTIANALVRSVADRGRAREIDVATLEPMLCATEGGRLDLPGWIYELKLDGVRIIAHKKHDQVALRYRSTRPVAASYPEIARAVRSLAPDELVLDGEIVAFDQQGKPSFQRIAQRIHAHRPADIKLAAAEVPVTYLVFDLLKLGSFDLRHLPLVERKRILAELVKGKGLVRLLDHVEDDGRPLFALCEAQGLEGVIAKRAASSYQPGPTRSGDWVKIKCEKDADFVVVGWTEGKGNRKRLGALELGSFDGKNYIYRGRVGSGLDDKLIDSLAPTLAELEQDSPAAIGDPIEGGGERHFVTPQIVVSVHYASWTDDGRLRHATFRGIRADVAPTDCREAPLEERIEQELEAPAAGSSLAPPQTETSNWKARVGRAELTNLDKVFWPENDYTKGDLLEYYAKIADTMLPYLEDRPVMIVRYPDGIAGKSFYQWNTPQGTPSWIRTLRLRDEERDGKQVDTFLVESVETLLYVINLGCIPLHVLAARRDSLEECDFLTIDLDPGEQPFSTVVRLTLTLKEILDEVGLLGFVKTSGQAGMHILIPVGAGVDFAMAKLLVELIGRLLQLRHPDLSTMERRVSDRGPRLFIDIGQTGRSRTIVAPYSARAYPGASVSTPLYWDEVHLALNPREFTLFTVPDRVREKGDPARELLDVHPDVATAVARLQKMFGL